MVIVEGDSGADPGISERGVQPGIFEGGGGGAAAHVSTESAKP